MDRENNIRDLEGKIVTDEDIQNILTRLAQIRLEKVEIQRQIQEQEEIMNCYLEELDRGGR